LVTLGTLVTLVTWAQVYVHVFDFGDFGVSFAATVAGRYTRLIQRRVGPRLSVRGEPLIVPTGCCRRMFDPAGYHKHVCKNRQSVMAYTH